MNCIQPRVHIRITNIEDYPDHGLQFYMQVSPRSAMVMASCHGSCKRYCRFVWNFDVQPGELHNLEIIAKTKRVFHSPQEYGRLMIPLGIIHPDTCLCDWFPIRLTCGYSKPMMIRMEIHYNTSGAEPFAAMPLHLIAQLGDAFHEPMLGTESIPGPITAPTTSNTPYSYPVDKPILNYPAFDPTNPSAVPVVDGHQVSAYPSVQFPSVSVKY